jgi:membrane protein
MKKLEELLARLTERWPLLAFLVKLVQVFLDRRVSRSAAELSYYLTLTLFPMLIVVIDVLGRLPLDAEEVVATISQVLPPDTASIVGSYLYYVQHHQSFTMLTAAILTIVMAASAAFRCIMTISEEIYGRAGFTTLWGMVYSFVLSSLLVVTIYLSFLVLLTGNWFLNLLREHLPPSVPIPDRWPSMRLQILFIVAMLFLALLYRIMGPKGQDRPLVIKGAFLSATLLTLGTNLFSTLIGFSSRFSLVYGSLASIIILMMWLFFCGNIVMLGIVFNYLRWCRKQGEEVVLLNEKQR